MKKIYSSSYRCNSSIFTAFMALFQQALDYRWQIWLSIKKKIHATYQQDVFGLFWSIVMPIIPMTVYMILAHIKVFKRVDDMPHIYYIAMGMLVWLLMSRTIHLMLLTLKAEKSTLTTTNFPIFPALLSRLGEVLHDTGIRLIVLILIVVWYQIDVNFTSVLLSILSLKPAPNNSTTSSTPAVPTNSANQNNPLAYIHHPTMIKTAGGIEGRTLETVMYVRPRLFFGLLSTNSIDEAGLDRPLPIIPTPSPVTAR